MTFSEIVNKVVREKSESASWTFAMNTATRDLSVNFKDLNYIDGYNILYSRRNIVSNKLETEDRPGYLFGSTIGILVVCPVEKDFPTVLFIYGRDFRTVEIESKFFKNYVRVKTNDANHIFRVDKKIYKDVEKLITTIRNS